jgi:hypothetical protein
MSSDGRRRRRYARELEHRLRELDRIDAERGLGAMPLHWPGPAPALAPPAARPPRPSLSPITAAVIMILALIALTTGVRVVSSYVENRNSYSPSRKYPTPVIHDGDGEYEFLSTQSDGRTPVTYNPCVPIRLEINPENAPPGYRKLVENAVVHTSTATGFEFDILGTTDSRDFRQRVSPNAAPPPVLVAWSDADEMPDLEGDVAGVAGSTRIDVRPGFSQYVTGTVILDRAAFDQLAASHDNSHAQAIIDHEFGHLVGLGHVKDRRELMFKDNVGQTGYGPGDLEGLARLGNVPCG